MPTGGTGGGTGPAAGSGGKAGSGGSVTGGTGGSVTGGTGGSGGSGGSAPEAVSVGKLDGMLVMTPCGDEPNGDDCAGAGWIYEGTTNPCVGGNLDTNSVPGKLDFAVTGEADKVYVATMHFYGVMEPKDYGNNAMREAGQARPNVGQNPSTPEPFATAAPNSTYDTSDYNTYEIHSLKPDGTEHARYYINSDTQEGHYTFAISYERPIEIIGGGKVHVRIFDDNCRMIKNCSTGGAPCTDKARSIDVSGADPAPMGLQQPGLGKQAAHSGQWFLIDVKEIVAKP
jgi:hypothetical protein